MLSIRMKPVEIHIHADRRLAFQVVTAYGARQPDGSSSEVLREEGGRKLVEFNTLMPTWRGGKKMYRTVEWVTHHEPQAVDFQGVEGPLEFLRDRFVFEDVGGCTMFRYESTFGLKRWILGWLMGRFYVKPILGAFMREHAYRLKETIEERARQSRIFPYRECGRAAP